MSRNFELLRATEDDGRIAAIKPANTFAGSQPSHVVRAPLAEPGQNMAWPRALEILSQHWRIATIFAASMFATVVVVTFVMKPVYEPSATIEIDPPGTQAFTLDGRGARADNAEYLETQSKSLQSEQLSLAIIRKLHLDQNPEFVKRSTAKEESEPQNTDPSAPQLSAGERDALRLFQKRLTVHRDTSSQLISVSFASHDPRTAAQVVNALVREFIENTHKTQHEAIMESSAWLALQLEDIRAKMKQANAALTAFQRETGIADVDNNRNTVAEQMAELDRQLAQAQGEKISAESYLHRVRDSSEPLPQLRENPVYQDLSQKLAEARADLAQAEVTYGKNHPNQKKIQNRVNQLQTELEQQKSAALMELRTRYAAANSREDLLKEELKNSSKELTKLAQFNALKKEAQTQTDLYNSLYARIKEAGIAAASNTDNMRVLDQARVLEKPTRPDVSLNLGLGLLASLIGGIMVAFAKEVFSTTIHTVADIHGITGVSAVSVLPTVNSRGLTRKERMLNPYTLLLHSPGSIEAEALRGLYTSVMLSRWGAPPHVLAVTSAVPGEGKTTVATNLAIALSKRESTCLVDTDIRKRSRGLFGLNSEVGWFNVLDGSASLDQAIANVPELPNLSFISAGLATSDPGELVPEQVSGIVSALRERFRFVVFDTPPILPYVDGRILSTLSDGLIFVGRYGTTTRSAMMRSMELLADIHAAPILDVVLNATDHYSAEYRYYGHGY